MTDDLALVAERIAALQDITFPLGGRHKSFARSVAGKPPAELSAAQRAHVTRLAWRYRRQMPAHLVPPGDPDANAAPRAVAEGPPAPASGQHAPEQPTGTGGVANGATNMPDLFSDVRTTP